MKRRTKDRLVNGGVISVLAVLVIVAIGFMVWVFAYFAGHMLDAAHEGNTAEAVAYGFLLLLIFWGGGRCGGSK